MGSGDGGGGGLPTMAASVTDCSSYEGGQHFVA